MPCYAPLRAYRTASGEVVFAERSRHDIAQQLSLPCGQCAGCRKERSRQWAVRCMHEAQMHKANTFVTLTYDDAHLPYRGQLVYEHYQKFMRRTRKALESQVRFFMCGEYGSLNWRPHFHAILFGVAFDDEQYWKQTGSGSSIYRSLVLERLWPFGFASIGRVTFESAAYCARYCLKKVTGFNAAEYYAREDADGKYSLVPPFAHMSLKPGIGSSWFDKYRSDVYPHDMCIVNGKAGLPPRFYDKLAQRNYSSVGPVNPFTWDEIQFLREKRGRECYGDNTEDRLKAKEIVEEARLKFLKRDI